MILTTRRPPLNVVAGRVSSRLSGPGCKLGLKPAKPARSHPGVHVGAGIDIVGPVRSRELLGMTVGGFEGYRALRPRPFAAAGRAAPGTPVCTQLHAIVSLGRAVSDAHAKRGLLACP